MAVELEGFHVIISALRGWESGRSRTISKVKLGLKIDQRVKIKLVLFYGVVEFVEMFCIPRSHPRPCFIPHSGCTPHASQSARANQELRNSSSFLQSHLRLLFAITSMTTFALLRCSAYGLISSEAALSFVTFLTLGITKPTKNYQSDRLLDTLGSASWLPAHARGSRICWRVVSMVSTRMWMRGR